MASKNSIKLFHKAARDLPGYKDFLHSHDFNPKTVKNAHSFRQVPRTTKASYLRKYPAKDLVWPEDQKNLLLYCSTSGSTGEPFYFPRTEKLSWQYSMLVENFLRQNPPKNGGSTLVVVGFGMGVWIGGIITLRAFEIAAQRMEAPVSILPTGYNTNEIYKALKKLGPNFEQTIIIGYPPFVKELVDEAPLNGIDLKKLNVRFLFAAESFTETFRNYICGKAGVEHPLLDTLNIYGTADIGAMAYETPVSILVRRIAIERQGIFRHIFGQIEKTPTLAQYNPDFMEFEEIDGEVLLTGNSAMPLIRYAIGDNGGTFSFSEIAETLRVHGIDLQKEIEKAGITHSVQEFPFVFVYERTDLSTTLHGANIYPEFIKESLFEHKLALYLTERFTMLTKFDRNQNQYLEINLEMQKGIEDPDEHLKVLAHKIIHKKLTEKSSEFAEIAKSRNSKKLLRLVFWRNGHPLYFPQGVKQKWVQKAD